MNYTSHKPRFIVYWISALVFCFASACSSTEQIIETPDLEADVVSEQPVESTRTGLPEGFSLYDRKPAGERYALLVGIGDYPGEENDLDGLPESDTERMKRALVANLGFKEENILTLLNAEADWQAIFDGFQVHLAQAGPDDAVFFYYSGHGTQLDENVYLEDYEPDGKDEGIVSWQVDGDPDNVEDIQIILDDHLNQLASGLNTKNTLFVMDSCHSGTITRNADFKPHFVDFAKLKKTFDATSMTVLDTRFTDDVSDASLEQPADHILLAAAAPDQSSYQTELLQSSVFTYYFLDFLTEINETTTFDDLMNSVGTQTNVFTLFFLDELQTPQAEGTRLSERVFDFLRR